MSRDTSLGLKFAGVMYYDGQGFMVNPAALKQKTGVDVKSAADLNGASVCTQTGTTTELNLADYFRSKNMTYEVVAFEKNEEVLKAYQEGRCDAYTTDQSGLYAEKLEAAESGRPCGSAGDHLQGAARPGGAPGRRWLVQRRQMDLFRAAQCRGARCHPGQCRGAEVQHQSGDQAAAWRRGRFRQAASASTNDWVVHIVKGVGNYGEIFERNVGESTNLKIARGKNALWNKGGLQYAPPIR